MTGIMNKNLNQLKQELCKLMSRNEELLWIRRYLRFRPLIPEVKKELFLMEREERDNLVRINEITSKLELEYVRC